MNSKKLAQELKKFGFETYEEHALNHFEELIKEEVETKFKAGVRKMRQNGGRIVLPLEYFGVSTNSYVENANPFTDMSVTDVHIRPALQWHDLSKGGALKQEFQVSERAVTEMLNEVSNGEKIENKKQTIIAMKKHIQTKATKFLNKVSKRGKLSHFGEHVVEYKKL